MKHHFKRERVKVDSIVFDAGTQIRVAINEQVVADYAERMTDGVEFPPIILFHDGVRYYLADGFHRTLAAKRNQFRDIDADVEVGTRADALWFALGANRTNGQRLTSADKKHAILLAIKAWPEKSQTQLAQQIGCTQGLVSQVISANNLAPHRPDRVTGKDGKQYPAGRELPPHVVDERRTAVAAMVKAGKQSIDIARELGVRGELVADVRRELGVGRADSSKNAVLGRLERIRQMAAEGYSIPQIAGDIGVGEHRVRELIGAHQIDVPASRVVARTRRHDANRIVERMALDAENLCADVNLIEFADLNRSSLAGWLTSFQASRDALNAFIRRLTKEQQKHGEAA